jgi:hypothetical protein
VKNSKGAVRSRPQKNQSQSLVSEMSEVSQTLSKGMRNEQRSDETDEAGAEEIQ